MIRYVNGSNYGYKDGKLLVKAQLECDELEELPAVDFFEGKLLDFCSECYVATKGDYYRLTSSGDWVKVNFMGNGEGGGGVTDEIEEGNMNPITSNAIYNKHRIKRAYLEKNDLSDVGITTTWGIGTRIARHAFRSGNIIVMNVSMRVTGTFTGSSNKMYDLWKMPFELCDDEGLIPPDAAYIISGTIDGNEYAAIKLYDGKGMYFQPNKVYNLNVQGQIILIATDYNY